MHSSFHDQLVYRRKLPHFQNPGAWYHVIFSLRVGRVVSAEGRTAVLSACRFHDGGLWNLAAVAVMPTLGTHVLCRPREVEGKPGNFQPLERILKSVKGFSARQILKLDGGLAPVWERESFDRQIRNERDFWSVVEYVEQNPVAAGLAQQPSEYPWLYVQADVARRDFPAVE